MAMTINTNVISINAQRNLGLSGNSMGTTMQRLSSGLRVNSAKDDAAGLAIAERMNSQARGLTVAARNANDGISLAQTAEGALGKVGDMLQRMRELAVQSSNATNSVSDREALQSEVNQLRAEIDRLAKTSSFNGKNLLDGSFAGGVFQVGAGAGDNITVGGITNAKASALSNISFGERTFAAGSMEMDITVGTDTVTLKGYAAKIDDTVLKIQVGSDDAIDLGEIAEASSAQERLGQVVAAINAKTADTGVTAFLTEEAGVFSVSLLSDKVDSDGVAEKVTLTGFTDLSTGFGVTVDVATAAPTNQADLDALIETAATTATGAANETVAIDAAAANTTDEFKAAKTQTGIEDLDISTQAGAWKALQKIDDAIDQINSARADLGALQTRFEKSIENIDIMNENISAARGRIVDADFASETANLSRAQILQQAGTAMVAQANQLPQQVLSLLQ